MHVTCEKCSTMFDDEYRWTICPHETFAANDGQNNFAHHPESFISKPPPTRLRYPPNEFYDRRVERLRKLISLKAPPITVANECMLVIAAINHDRRLRTVWFVFKDRCLDHARNKVSDFFYDLRYRLSGHDPYGIFDKDDAC